MTKHQRILGVGLRHSIKRTLQRMNIISLTGQFYKTKDIPTTGQLTKIQLHEVSNEVVTF